MFKNSMHAVVWKAMSNPDPVISTTELHALRIDYRQGTLDASELAADPFAQFAAWFDHAKSASLREPNAMTLATVDADGQPSARVVLLKDFDPRGFTFFGNYGSRKARALDAQPKASLLFFWDALERQVRVEGTVAKLPREESASYFSIRPRGAQIGAWASRQSEIVDSRAALEANVKEIETRFPDVVPIPDFWGGWRLVPTALEFWQGGPGRLHDRFRYTKTDNRWTLDRLAP